MLRRHSICNTGTPIDSILFACLYYVRNRSNGYIYFQALHGRNHVLREAMVLKLACLNAKNVWKVTTVQKTNHLTTVSRVQKDIIVRMEPNPNTKIRVNLVHTTVVFGGPSQRIASRARLVIIVQNGVKN